PADQPLDPDGADGPPAAVSLDRSLVARRARVIGGRRRPYLGRRACSRSALHRGVYSTLPVAWAAAAHHWHAGNRNVGSFIQHPKHRRAAGDFGRAAQTLRDDAPYRRRSALYQAANYWTYGHSTYSDGTGERFNRAARLLHAVHRRQQRDPFSGGMDPGYAVSLGIVTGEQD